MMIVLFTLLLLITILIWRGYRRASLICLALTMLCATALFFHDVTSHIAIQL